MVNFYTERIESEDSKNLFSVFLMFDNKEWNSDVAMIDGVLILFRIFKISKTWEKLQKRFTLQ